MNLDALELMENMISMKEVITNRIEDLSKKQRELDCKILDIQHVMEFYDFNASRNSKLVTLMKEVLRERRDVKDEQQILLPFVHDQINLKRNCGAHKHMKTLIEKIENEKKQRKYKVRIMHELFGDTLTADTKPFL